MSDSSEGSQQCSVGNCLTLYEPVSAWCSPRQPYFAGLRQLGHSSRGALECSTSFRHHNRHCNRHQHYHHHLYHHYHHHLHHQHHHCHGVGEESDRSRWGASWRSQPEPAATVLDPLHLMLHSLHLMLQSSTCTRRSVGLRLGRSIILVRIRPMKGVRAAGWGLPRRCHLGPRAEQCPWGGGLPRERRSPVRASTLHAPSVCEHPSSVCDYPSVCASTACSVCDPWAKLNLSLCDQMAQGDPQ